MEAKRAKELTDRIFEKILRAESIEALKKILEDFDQKNKMNSDKYPRIKFKINYDEIEKHLNEEGNLPNDNSLITDPLAKLLYALAWKNGDLVKIKHIVKGIKDVENHSFDKDDGLVFYQFGKYLAKKNNEPIIDQHVIRAFKVFQSKNDNEIESLRKINLLNNKIHKNYIEDYKQWLRKDSNIELRNHEDFTYYVDQILFALGKTIKLKNGRTN